MSPQCRSFTRVDFSKKSGAQNLRLLHSVSKSPAASSMQLKRLPKPIKCEAGQSEHHTVVPSFSLSSSPSVFTDGHQSDAIPRGPSWDSREESFGASEDDDDTIKSSLKLKTGINLHNNTAFSQSSFASLSLPKRPEPEYSGVVPSATIKGECLSALQPLVEDVSRRDYMSLWFRVREHASSVPFPRSRPETLSPNDPVDIPAGDPFQTFIFWVLVGEIFSSRSIEILQARIIAPTISKHRLVQQQQQQQQKPACRLFRPIGSFSSFVSDDLSAKKSFHALFSPHVTPSFAAPSSTDRSSPSLLGKRTFSSVADQSATLFAPTDKASVTVEYLLKLRTLGATSSAQLCGTPATHLWRTYHVLTQSNQQQSSLPKLQSLRRIFAKGLQDTKEDVRGVIDAFVALCVQLLRGDDCSTLKTATDVSLSTTCCHDHVSSHLEGNASVSDPSFSRLGHKQTASLSSGASLHHALPTLYATAQEQRHKTVPLVTKVYESTKTTSCPSQQPALDATCVLLEGHMQWGISPRSSAAVDFNDRGSLRVLRSQWRIVAESSTMTSSSSSVTD